MSRTAQSASASPANTTVNAEGVELSDLSLPGDMSAIDWENLTSSFASSTSSLVKLTPEEEAQLDDGLDICARVEAADASAATKKDLLSILTDSDGAPMCHSQK